jgi:ribonuclease G
MSLDVLINVNPKHSMMAMIEDGRLLEMQVETKTSQSLVGNIYKGKVRRVVAQMQAIFVDVGLSEPGFLSARDAGNAAKKSGADIEQLFKEGQIVWVQCVKDQVISDVGLPDKGIRLSTQLSLSTSNLVYLPNSSNIGASKKLGDYKQRQSYIDQLTDVQRQNSGGFVIRTGAKKLAAGKLHLLAERLIDRWNEVKDLMREMKEVGLVYQVPNLLESISQECFQIHANKLFLNKGSQELAEKIRKNIPSPALIIERVEFEEVNLLKEFSINEQLSEALSTKVKLSCGGSIVIEKTEALTSIDVNMGSAVEAKISEQELNMHAAKIIAQQLRLRNLSGIIIVDFISLRSEQEKRALLNCFAEYLENDPIRAEIHGMTTLGLVELTRERIKSSLDQQLAASELFAACRVNEH